MSRESEQAALIPSQRGEFGCWVRVGSHGDASCPRLPEGGCRECPEYFRSGLGLYDRELPEGYSLEWTRILAEEKKLRDEDAVSHLVFRIGDEALALRTARFEEIRTMGPARSVPGRKDPAFIGLVNVNGELLPCLSLAALLGIAGKKAGTGKAARLIVVRGASGRFAFPVDAVLGAHRLKADEGREVPATVSRAPAPMTRSVFFLLEKTVGVLDEDQVFAALERSIGA